MNHICTLNSPVHIHTIALAKGPFQLYMPDLQALYATAAAGTLWKNMFWARLWPSAIALANFVQSNPDCVAGKKVAELAAGLGLPSMVAAAYAQQVWCSDKEEAAAAVMARSARLHGYTNISTVACNWKDVPAWVQPEVLLLSDVNYEPAVFASLLAVIHNFLEQGTTIMLATPQRLLAKPFIENLLPFVVHQCMEEVETNGQCTSVSIFTLKING